MIKLLADENFNRGIVRGLFLRQPHLDLVRVQEVGLSGRDDPALLEWAAAEDRLLLSHDYKTVPRYAYDRVDEGQPMPGVIICDQAIAPGAAIEEILLIAECSEPGENENLVLFLPL